MEKDFNVLDKTALKKAIVKSKIVFIWDIYLLYLFALLCWKGVAAEEIGCVLILVNVFKIALIMKHLRHIDEDEFFVVKSVIIGEDISEGEDSNTYYKIFRYPGAYGEVKQRVSSKIFKRYKNGDCFYLVFFKNAKNEKKPAKYIFPCDEYMLDSELKKEYTDCSYYDFSAEREVKEKVPYVSYQEQLNSLTEEQKTKILCTGKQVSRLGKGMLVSGIILFILFIVYLATMNAFALIFTLLSGAVFFFCLFRMLAVTNKTPEYDAIKYADLKRRLSDKEKEDEPFNRDFPDEEKMQKQAEKNNLTLLQKLRRIPAFVIGTFSLLSVCIFLSEGVAYEDVFLVVFFILALLVSVLMLFTKIRFLSLLYASTMFFSCATDLYILKGKGAAGTVCLVMGLIFVAAVVLLNRRKR